MSDKLKRVLDTNLAGLHVTDAQVNAVLRRVSQDEQRPRVIRWQAIAAVLLVLVLGAGVLLQTGILSDDSPQLTADVTRQGDFLTAAQVKKLLASAADLQFSVDEEAISALMTQVEKDGGCSLSTLLEILCPVGSSLGQWDIRAQVALSQTLERIGYQGILPGMTREPLSTEITAQDALARAVAYIRTNDDPQADFTNLDFYRVGIRFLSGVYDGTCEGAYYCVNFDALDAFGTTYEVAVNAEDGSICRMRRERGAGSNHTADEVTRGFRRIFGYDMRTWTPLQLRVYILALSRADHSSMQTVHELFLSVGRDGFPDVPAEALTREEAIDAALAIQGGSSSDVLAAEYLAGASGDFWKIAIRQPNAPSGQSIVYLELNGLTGALLTTTYSGNLYGLPQEFFPSQLLSTLDRTDFSHGVPAVDAETAQSAASDAIQRQYQRNMAEEGYTCFIESDFEDTAGGFSYYTGGGVVIFTKDAQNTSQGDIYWAVLNWYGEVLDVGWNRNPLDAARFTLLMQGYLPPIYQRETVQQLQALLTGSQTDEAGLRQMETDGTLPLFNALLALEVVPDASTKSTADDVTAAALKSLNAHLCYENSSFLVYREDGELIWHFWLSTDMGYFLLDVRDSDLSVVGSVQVPSFSALRASILLPVRVWNTLAEDLRVTSFYLDANTQPGIVYGMYANHIVQRYVDLYGANILRWDQATLRSFQSAISISGSYVGDWSVACLCQTIYPDVPDYAISQEVAAEYAARALGDDDYSLRGGVLIDPGEGDPIWKVTLDYPDGRSFNAEVDCRTGAIRTLRQQDTRAMPFYTDYLDFPDDGEYWFRNFVLDEVIEQVRTQMTGRYGNNI